MACLYLHRRHIFIFALNAFTGTSVYEGAMDYPFSA